MIKIYGDRSRVYLGILWPAYGIGWYAENRQAERKRFARHSGALMWLEAQERIEDAA